jgi:hypothetical protein
MRRNGRKGRKVFTSKWELIKSAESGVSLFSIEKRQEDIKNCGVFTFEWFIRVCVYYSQDIIKGCLCVNVKC